MLPAPNRLRHRRDIDRTHQRGSYGAGEGWLSVKAAFTKATTSRAVVVVSKKVDKRAVVRNANRRRTAAALAGIWATVPAGYDIVISIHRDTREVSSVKLSQTLISAFRRARVLPQ